MQSFPMHRIIVAVDIERATTPLRTDTVEEALRREVYRILEEAVVWAGLDYHHLDAFEDRGDGVLALVRPADDVPTSLLFETFIPELERLLRDYNARVAASERSAGLGIRLRVAVHAGEIHFDGHGFFGEEIDVACRLLDAPRFKRHLTASSGPLALVVSDDLYWSVVRDDDAGIYRDDFHPLVRLKVAGRVRRGHVFARVSHPSPAATGLFQAIEAHVEASERPFDVNSALRDLNEWARTQDPSGKRTG